MSKREYCPQCEGTGQIEVGHHYVTRDMALDAGDVSMEGMDYGPEWGTCPNCNGYGIIEAENEDLS